MGGKDQKLTNRLAGGEGEGYYEGVVAREMGLESPSKWAVLIQVPRAEES